MCGFSKKPSVEKLWREKANRERAFDVIAYYVISVRHFERQGA